MSRSRVIIQTLLMLLLVGIGAAVGWRFGPGAGAATANDHAETDGHEGHDHSEHGHDHGVPTATGEGDKHVPLSREAAMSLGLQVGPVALGDHVRYITIPGKVISKPTGGHRTIASPVTGVVRQVAASIGTAVSPGSQLFSIEITDQELLDTQTSVLDTMGRLKVVLREIDRLNPLVQNGIVGGAKLRDAKYEKDQLLAKLAALQQSLTSYGFGPDEMAVLAKQQTLVRSVTVEAAGTSNKTSLEDNSPAQNEGSLPQPQSPLKLRGPGSASAPTTNSTVQVAYTDTADADSEDSITDNNTAPKDNLPIDEIHAQVGQTVNRGDALCTLGNHAKLLVEGNAFNKDLDLLAKLLADDGRVTVQFGHRSSGKHDHDRERNDLEILYIDDEVDPETQTVKFYVRLENEVLHRKPSDDGGEYITWLFRHGQNVHIRVPSEQWDDVLRVPRDSVVKQGPNAFVFRRIGGTMGEPAHDHDDHAAHDHDGDGHPDHEVAGHDSDEHADHVAHDHDGDGKPDHAAAPVPHDHDGDGIPDHGPGAHAHDEEFYLEFEPVPVLILHEDDDAAILDGESEITVGDIIALNNAYQLYLASQMNAGGGGGQDHGHEH